MTKDAQYDRSDKEKGERNEARGRLRMKEADESGVEDKISLLIAGIGAGDVFGTNSQQSR